MTRWPAFALSALCLLSITARAETVTFPGARSAQPDTYPVAATVRGHLRLPDGRAAERLPAVVILHGSAGIDGRGEFHGAALRAAGFATLELDMFRAGERPREGSRMTMSHAYGALKFLASHPRIDPARIGAIGFSWGANMALRMSSADVRDAFAADLGGADFRAFVAFYPVCHLHMTILRRAEEAGAAAYRRFTGAPLWLAIGALDDYGDPAECGRFVETVAGRPGARLTFTLYPGATHGWDVPPTGNRTVFDPVAHGGRGGQVRMFHHPAVAEQSRTAVVAFFRDHLAPARR